MGHDLPVTEEDSIKNLSTLALFIAHEARQALSAAFVLKVARAFFYQYPEAEKRRRFRTNPANTLAYQALIALEERAIVTIAEWLKDEHKLHPTTVAIRRKRDLFLHRNSLSHPATVKWHNPAMREFADEKRDYKDNRPALLWDLQRSINDALREAGEETHFDGPVVTSEMVRLLHTILVFALSSDVPPPSEAELVAYMHGQLPKYMSTLEADPSVQPTGEP